jgi:hypothetical protein
LTGGHVRKDGTDALEQRPDGPLKHRAAMTGPETFTVDDAHAPQLSVERVGQEFAQRLLGLGDCKAMQVYLGLHSVLAPAKFAQHGGLHAGPVEHELVTARKGRVARVPRHALAEHRETVRTSKLGARGRPASLGHRRFALERPDTSDGLPKQPGVLLIVVRAAHATSAESGSSI